VIWSVARYVRGNYYLVDALLKMNPYDKYYIPYNRKELIAFLVRRWPNGNWQKKPRAMLYAVYRKTRDKEG